MTGRVLHTEADIRAAGAAAVRAWREGGWQLPEQRVEHAAAILAPVTELPRGRGDRGAAA